MHPHRRKKFVSYFHLLWHSSTCSCYAQPRVFCRSWTFVQRFETSENLATTHNVTGKAELGTITTISWIVWTWMQSCVILQLVRWHVRTFSRLTELTHLQNACSRTPVGIYNRRSGILRSIFVAIIKQQVVVLSSYHQLLYTGVLLQAFCKRVNAVKSMPENVLTNLRTSCKITQDRVHVQTIPDIVVKVTHCDRVQPFL